MSQSKPLPKILSRSWLDRVEKASETDLLQVWLPQVCAQFDDDAFGAVWMSLNNLVEDAPNQKRKRKIASNIRQALKTHSALIDEKAWKYIAYRALQDGDYAIALDAIKSMLRQNPDALNQWCRLEPPHMQLLAHGVTHNIHGKTAPLSTVVLAHLNAKSHAKLRATLINNSSALYWKSLNTKSPNFCRIDALLEILPAKINLVFKNINVSQVADIYAPNFSNTPAFASWSKRLNKDFDSGVLFGDLFETSIYAARAIHGAPLSNLHALYEGRVAGGMAFLSRHLDRLSDNQCRSILNAVQTMSAQGVPLNLASINLLEIQARVDKKALQDEMRAMDASAGWPLSKPKKM